MSTRNSTLELENQTLKKLQKEGVEMSIGVHRRPYSHRNTASTMIHPYPDRTRIEELEAQVKMLQLSLKNAESEAGSAEQKAAAAQEEAQKLKNLGILFTSSPSLATVFDRV